MLPRVLDGGNPRLIGHDLPERDGDPDVGVGAGRDAMLEPGLRLLCHDKQVSMLEEERQVTFNGGLVLVQHVAACTQR
jgi:hypothetical protein